MDQLLQFSGWRTAPPRILDLVTNEALRRARQLDLDDRSAAEGWLAFCRKFPSQPGLPSYRELLEDEFESK